MPVRPQCSQCLLQVLCWRLRSGLSFLFLPVVRLAQFVQKVLSWFCFCLIFVLAPCRFQYILLIWRQAAFSFSTFYFCFSSGALIFFLSKCSPLMFHSRPSGAPLSSVYWNTTREIKIRIMEPLRRKPTRKILGNPFWCLHFSRNNLNKIQMIMIQHSILCNHSLVSEWVEG